MVMKYGEVDWNDTSSGSDFMNLEQGDNNVRVFTPKPYQFVVHWVKDSTGSSRKIKCAIENCPLCKKGIDAKIRYYLGVIDRSSGQAKLLEIGPQVLISLKQYKDDKKWGDISMYDVNIRKNPKGTNPLYTVLPDPNKGPLTDEEKALAKSFMNRVDINKFTVPLKPEEIAEKLGMSFSSNTNEKQQQNERPVISEDDFNFGNEL